MKQLQDLLVRLEHLGMGKRAVHKLGRKAMLFLRLPENQDGRGTKVRAKKTALTTMRHLLRAQRYCASTTDQQVGRLAQKLVKSSYHVDFATLVDLAREFCGAANRRVATIREQQIRESEKQVVPLIMGYELEKITTTKFLQSIGRRFKNCLAHPRSEGWRYHRDLRNSDSEFWLLCKDSVPLCVIAIDLSTRSIEECQGPGGEDFDLSRSIALDVCDKLNAIGDDNDSFARVGAFGMFQSSVQTPKFSEVEIKNQTLRLWVHNAELVIRVQEERTNKILWSKFEFDNGEFEGSWRSEMQLGQLLALAVESDELRDVLSQVHSHGSVVAKNTPQRRRGRRARAPF